MEYLHCAGRQAVQRSANAEAVTHLTTALALLKTLPDGPERARHELALQLTLGPAWMATKGFAAPEMEATYTRALALCRQLGEETIQVFPALMGLRNSFLARGELQTARELGEQLLTLAQKAQDPALLVQAHRVLGTSLLALGELGAARTQLEQALALYDPGQCRSPALFLEPGVLALAIVTMDLWLLGYPDQALKRSQEALALAQTLSHPPASATALLFAAELHLYRGESQPMRELAEAAIAVATEHGFPFWLAYGTIHLGWALVAQGDTAQGIKQMQQGLSAYRALGAELWQTHFLALLAEAYGKAQQAEAGLQMLTEALAVAERTHERLYEAELYRLKGELMLLQPGGGGEAGAGRDKAEACFQRAIAIARRQDSRSLELRAVMALSRLWRQQGKGADARKLLAKSYGRFTEGFDTADQQEAKALLAELD